MMTQEYKDALVKQVEDIIESTRTLSRDIFYNKIHWTKRLDRFNSIVWDLDSLKNMIREIKL